MKMRGRKKVRPARQRRDDVGDRVRETRHGRPLHPPITPSGRRWFAGLGVLAVFLQLSASCIIGPNYVRPPAPVPGAYKEMEGWKRAEPKDHLLRGEWWALFNDPQLAARLKWLSHRPAEELYDLADDEFETKNLADTNPAKVNELRRILTVQQGLDP